MPLVSLLRAAVAGTLTLTPAIALATTPAADSDLRFTVLKDGDPIGTHEIVIHRSGDRQTVSIDTAVVVRVAFVPVYRFEQTASEVWQNGRILSLESKTDDDGTNHSMAATAGGMSLEVTGDGKHSQVDPDIMPASLWNREIVDRHALLDTIDGSVITVNVADLGASTLSSGDTRIVAEHYRMTGQFERDLWFDPSGRLVQVEFKAQDGSDILYRLQ